MMSTTTLDVNGNNQPLYAAKKRKRPQTKKEKVSDQPVKSNPSKRHRDRLNTELDHLAKLIPFPDDILNKLDKLSILRLAVAYLKNKNYHTVESTTPCIDLDNELGQLITTNNTKDVAGLKESESSLALSALHGFLIVVTQDFNIFYVTETVQDFLGFPQCDVMNLSMLDLIHAEDRKTFMRHMQINPNQPSSCSTDDNEATDVPEYTKYGMTPDMFREFSQDGILHRSFICRLRCLLDNSSGFLALHFTGHLRLVAGQNKKSDGKVPLPPEMALFLLASPLQSPSILEIRTKCSIFRTKHKLDYTPLAIDAKGRVVLGYTEQQLRQRSGYEFVHSADMMHCADAHTKLMRKGESGLTVFRLLHKDNTWVWVTASARLVFRNGQPDCIIATQRPILDQEGEEHMKKRTNAFRFDFTGQAVLYGEVNPIGTRGGPEKNPLNEAMNDEPMCKRQRLTNNAEAAQAMTMDRKTLSGAQAMQRMDIYVGSLPNVPNNIYSSGSAYASAGAIEEMIKNEQVNIDSGPLTDESNITFYPIGSEVPPQSDSVGRMDQNYQVSPNHEMSSLTPTTINAQPINNLAGNMQACASTTHRVPDGNQQHMTNYEPPRLYHPPTDSNVPDSGNVMYSPTIPKSPLKRPYSKTDFASLHSTQWNQQQQVQQQHQQMHSGSFSEASMSPMSTTSAKSENMLMQQQKQPYPDFSQQITAPKMNQNHCTTNLYFSGPKSSSQRIAADDQYNQNHAELNGYVQPMNNCKYQDNQQQPSVIEAMTINSLVHMNPNNQVSETSNNMQTNSINRDVGLPVPPNWDTPQLVGCQENTIQFDLDKIASDYQTTDPMSKVQNYLHDHPAQAMAIATGLMPEEGMPTLAPNKVEAYMPSCQYQQSQRPPTQGASMQSQNQVNSIGKNMNYYPNMVGDDMSYLTPSISSTDSIPSSNFADQGGSIPANFKQEQAYT